MRIGIAGPMTLDLFRPYLPASSSLPKGYPFPMTAALVCELLDRGHEVTAYTTSTEIIEPLYISHPPFTLCVSPSLARHRGRNLFRREISGLKQAFITHPCDLIHAFWTYEFAIAALGSRLPTLITLEDWARAIFLMEKDVYRLIRWGMDAYTVRRAPNLSVISPYLLRALPSPARERAVVIPNFIQESVAGRARPATVRQKYIVSVSNGFSQRKNLGNALLGFRQAQPALQDVRYVLVGVDCQPGGPAQQFCAQNDCLQNVEFAGPVSYDRVLELIANAAFMVHPSHEESFGMSVLEAMALGTPVIAGERSGNMPHLIQHRRSGYLCDVANPSAIADALRTLHFDDSLRNQIGITAHRHALENYSSSVVVDMYLDSYQTILKGHPITAETALCA